MGKYCQFDHAKRNFIFAKKIHPKDKLTVKKYQKQKETVHIRAVVHILFQGRPAVSAIIIPQKLQKSIEKTKKQSFCWAVAFFSIFLLFSPYPVWLIWIDR